MNLQEKLQRQFAIPVLRLTDPATVEYVVEALFKAGFGVQELTLMTANMIPLISKLKKRLPVVLGAGTVLNEEQAEKAFAAGADFLVSPGFSRAVSQVAKKNSLLYIPGVMTPTEITEALASEHQLLKLFPVGNLGGLAYLKSLQGPFPHVQWMLSGGIKLSEVNSLRAPGVACVGLGNDLFPPELVEKGDWAKITQLAQEVLKKGSAP